jgi:hypothetical protein
MDKKQFRDVLIFLFPGFESYWDDEDINREDDGSFTAHGLLSSFFFFYKAQHLNLEEKTISELATKLEEIVSADPNDESDVANAICTSFLELVDENREGKVLEKYLGKECLKFLEAMRGYDGS